MNGFDNLSIEEQVNTINKLLATDRSLSINKICDKLEIPSSTLKSRLYKENYKFNKSKRIYQLQKEYSSKDSVKTHEKVVDNFLERKEGNYMTQSEIAVTSELSVNYKDVDTDKLKFIIDNIDTLEKILNQYQENNIKGCIIDLSLCTEKSVNRNFKVYSSVLKKLTKLQKQYSMFKIQDLVSTALNEYCDKYLK